MFSAKTACANMQRALKESLRMFFLPAGAKDRRQSNQTGRSQGVHRTKSLSTQRQRPLSSYFCLIVVLDSAQEKRKTIEGKGEQWMVYAKMAFIDRDYVLKEAKRLCGVP